MSAFVVDKAHINAMIDAGLSVRYRPMHWYPEGKEGSSSLTEINASEVGQMLLEECIKSVGYRYEDSEVTDLPGRSDAEYIIPFQYKRFANPPTPIEILKIISCYEYQSCEHPGFPLCLSTANSLARASSCNPNIIYIPPSFYLSLPAHFCRLVS